MTLYTVNGLLEPYSSKHNIGEPIGIINEKDYWSWENDAGTWYLWFVEQEGMPYYCLGQTLEDIFTSSIHLGIEPIGEYQRYGFLGVIDAIITEYKEEELPITYYTIQNISSESTSVNNSSIVNVTNSNVVKLKINTTAVDLNINNIQDKYDNRFNDRTYYWNKQIGV